MYYVRFTARSRVTPGGCHTIRYMVPVRPPDKIPGIRSGRAANQLRPVSLTPDYVATAEGSILISIGHTRVLCNASIEQGVPAWLRNSGRGWVTAEYGMLP